MRGEECETCAEDVIVDDFVTTGILPRLGAAEMSRLRTIDSRARKDVNERTGLGFAHISNAAS